MPTFAELIASQTEALNAARALMQVAGETALKELFAGIFKEFPEVLAIGWCQYTPGFNDGDPCLFSLNDVMVVTTESLAEWPSALEGVAEGEGWQSAYNFTDYKNGPIIAIGTRHNGEPWDRREPIQSPLAKMLNELTGLLSSAAGLDFLDTSFGNDKEIIALPSGEFKVDDYDCGY